MFEIRITADNYRARLNERYFAADMPAADFNKFMKAVLALADNKEEATEVLLNAFAEALKAARTPDEKKRIEKKQEALQTFAGIKAKAPKEAAALKKVLRRAEKTGKKLNYAFMADGFQYVCDSIVCYRFRDPYNLPTAPADVKAPDFARLFQGYNRDNLRPARIPAPKDITFIINRLKAVDVRRQAGILFMGVKSRAEKRAVFFSDGGIQYDVVLLQEAIKVINPDFIGTVGPLKPLYIANSKTGAAALLCPMRIIKAEVPEGSAAIVIERAPAEVYGPEAIESIYINAGIPDAAEAPKQAAEGAAMLPAVKRPPEVKTPVNVLKLPYMAARPSGTPAVPAAFGNAFAAAPAAPAVNAGSSQRPAAPAAFGNGPADNRPGRPALPPAFHSAAEDLRPAFGNGPALPAPAAAVADPVTVSAGMPAPAAGPGIVSGGIRYNVFETKAACRPCFTRAGNRIYRTCMHTVSGNRFFDNRSSVSQNPLEISKNIGVRFQKINFLLTDAIYTRGAISAGMAARTIDRAEVTAEAFLEFLTRLFLPVLRALRYIAAPVAAALFSVVALCFLPALPFVYAPQLYKIKPPGNGLPASAPAFSFRFVSCYGVHISLIFTLCGIRLPAMVCRPPPPCASAQDPLNVPASTYRRYNTAEAVAYYSFTRIQNSSGQVLNSSGQPPIIHSDSPLIPGSMPL